MFGDLMKRNQEGQKTTGTGTPLATTTPDTTTTPVASLVARPASITTGTSTALYWASSGTSWCVIGMKTSSGVKELGRGASNGRIKTPRLTATTEFRLACGSGESTLATARAVVDVEGGTEEPETPEPGTPEPETPTPEPEPETPVETGPAALSFSARPNPINMLGQSQLTWSSAGTAACSIAASDGTVIQVDKSGQVNTPPLISTTDYTITCTVPGKAPLTSKATVVVRAWGQ